VGGGGCDGGDLGCRSMAQAGAGAKTPKPSGWGSVGHAVGNGLRGAMEEVGEQGSMWWIRWFVAVRRCKRVRQFGAKTELR
jgi:hypothetical protein